MSAVLLVLGMGDTPPRAFAVDRLDQTYHHVVVTASELQVVAVPCMANNESPQQLHGQQIVCVGLPHTH